MISFYKKFCAGLYYWFQRKDDMPKFYTWSASSGFLIFALNSLFNIYILITKKHIYVGRLDFIIGLSVVLLNAVYQFFKKYDYNDKRYSVITTKIIFLGSLLLFLITILSVGPTKVN